MTAGAGPVRNRVQFLGGPPVDAHYPTADEPATPEYVLAVLQDMHRQQCRYDPEADPEAELSPDTTVAEWRAACDLLGWRAVGRWCNRLWGIGCSDDDWRAVLEPPDRRRLSDVCRLVASHAARPRIRPARCLPAGAFLTVRSLLTRAGADPAGIAPSTPLGPYARRYPGVFLGPVARLAPGALPPVRVRVAGYRALLFIMVGGLAGGAVASDVGWPMLAIAGYAAFGLCYALHWVVARLRTPTSVEFGDLRTFRDLSIVLARADGR